MDRTYIKYKCISCHYEIEKSFYSSGEYGDWRCGFDLQQANADKENELLDNPCPACKKGKMERKN